MKSAFSRNFSSIAIILLLALCSLGVAFQLLVREYLTENTVSALQNDAQIIANLASAYSMDGGLQDREFILNLDVASQVSDSDVVIFDEDGKVVLCSDALHGCEHQGLRLNEDYLQKVRQNGTDVATGLINGLYTDHRFVVATTISSGD